ncbi:MAG: ABC transporter substrate-binding protein [Actinobacteria bacterium]|nr:ABC transporter substrate-binding protein [Actinomycetota bacterium]
MTLLLVVSGCRVGVHSPASGAGATSGNLGLTGVRAPSETAGGTLRLVAGPIASLDPTRSYQYGSWNFMRLYTRQLVTFAPRPGPAGAGVVPDLAASLGRVSNGGRSWTYTLRTGIRFENGQPITAVDVKYGIERAFAAGTLAGGPSWLVQLLDNPKDPFPGPYQDKDLHKGGLAAITTPDARTVVFRLTKPFADFDRVLALPDASPVPAALDTGKDYGAKPVSSGPYRFAGPYHPTITTTTTGTASHGTVVLVRNTQWDRRTDLVRTALPDRIELVVGLTPTERDARLRDGGADLDITGSGLQPDSVASTLRDRDLAARTDNPINSSLRMLALPATVAPMRNPHCRYAVQYAVDKAAIKDGLGGDYGATLATSLWPRTLPGYPASAPFPSGEGNHGDLARARGELAACGHPGGFSTRIATVGSGRSLRIAQEVSTALARVGIEAEVRPFPEEVFLTSGAGAPKAIADGGYGIVVVSWSADFPSLAAFLPPLLDSRNTASLGNTNYAQLSDLGLARLADSAAGEVDPVVAGELWRRVNAVAMQRAGYVPLVEDKVVLLTSARVRNAYVQVVWGNHDLVSVGVA